MGRGWWWGVQWGEGIFPTPLGRGCDGAAVLGPCAGGGRLGGKGLGPGARGRDQLSSRATVAAQVSACE